MGYRDCVYDFFYAPESRTYYLLVDRLLTDKTHDLNVYAVEGPLALDNNTGQHFDTLAGSRTWIMVDNRRTGSPWSRGWSCPGTAPSPQPSDRDL